MIVCLACTAAAAELEELAPGLNSVSPRVVIEPRGIVWCDAQGLDPHVVATQSLQLSTAGGKTTRAGVAQTPIAAEVAAIAGSAGEKTPPVLTFVPSGEDARFLAGHPIEVLDPSPHIRGLLRGSGVEKCGDLAALDHESVEVRFGAEGSRLWRLARADDRRRLFPAMPRTLPEASFEWLDYVLTEPERLLFVINGLMGSICMQLADRGGGARDIALVFSLANRSTYEHVLRPARVTASQRAWMRLVRSELERIQLPDAVTGISLRVLSLGGELGSQGDLFDRGFASAAVTEETIAQLLDDRGSVILRPRFSAHTLVDRRTEWVPQDAATAVISNRLPVAGNWKLEADLPPLTLQLLPEPRSILVETERRRDHEVPVRCCLEDGWEDVSSSAGPDRVSGGDWNAPFAREYYRCVTHSGRMLWVFREDPAQWFLQGWWD
jgi:hypothetical protein